MQFDRAFGDLQQFADLAVAFALGHFTHHLHLAARSTRDD
jgi:hypothetical protein